MPSEKAKSLKHITVPSFHEIKGRSSACRRKILRIRRALETFEEGSLEIDFM